MSLFVNPNLSILNCIWIEWYGFGVMMFAHRTICWIPLWFCALEGRRQMTATMWVSSLRNEPRTASTVPECIHIFLFSSHWTVLKRVDYLWDFWLNASKRCWWLKFWCLVMSIACYCNFSGPIISLGLVNKHLHSNTWEQQQHCGLWDKELLFCDEDRAVVLTVNSYGLTCSRDNLVPGAIARQRPWSLTATALVPTLRGWPLHTEITGSFCLQHTNFSKCHSIPEGELTWIWFWSASPILLSKLNLPAE